MIKYALRIEDHNKKGPYIGSDRSWYREQHNYDTGRPSPPSNFAKEYEVKYGVKPLFGFRNWKQAKQWFLKKELIELHKLGFRWRWYKAWNPVDVDGKQIAFYPMGKHRHHKGP